MLPRIWKINGSMSQRPLPTLLLIALATLDCNLLRVDSASPMVTAVILGLLLGQVAALGCWLAEGRMHVLLRCLVALLAMPLLALLASRHTRPDMMQWLAVLWANTGGIVVVLMAMRWMQREDQHPNRALTAGWRRRISPRTITAWFVITTISALALLQVRSFPRAHILEVLPLVAVLAGVAGVVRWSAERFVSWKKVMLLLIIVPLAAWLLKQGIQFEYLPLALAVQAASSWVAIQILHEAREISPSSLATIGEPLLEI